MRYLNALYQNTNRHSVAKRRPRINTHMPADMVQRKASCSCGGVCPACQSHDSLAQQKVTEKSNKPEEELTLEHAMTTAPASAVRPDLVAIASNPTVHTGIDNAWAASNPNTPGTKKENGCWIIKDDTTGTFSVQVFPMAGARRDQMRPGAPPVIAGKTTVAFFHTHPNTVAEGYAWHYSLTCGYVLFRTCSDTIKK